MKRSNGQKRYIYNKQIALILILIFIILISITINNFISAYNISTFKTDESETIIDTIITDEPKLIESEQIKDIENQTDIETKTDMSQLETEKITVKTTETIINEKTITLSFAGDCILGYDDARGYWSSFNAIFEKQNKDYSYFFKNVLPIFEKDDLTIVNLENPLTNSTAHATKEFVFKGLPEFTNILKEGSVESVNLANNHTYDYLQKGYDDTLNNLREAKINYFGENLFNVIEVKGVKIGLLGYKGWNINKEIKKRIVKNIAFLRENDVKIIVATFHWGIERENYPNDIQKELAHFAIDNGADLIIGHHPHVIQGIELYKEKYIVYSLGNFSFGGNRNPTDKDTFIFQQSYNLLEDEIIDSNIKVIPCSISSIKENNNFQPTPTIGEDTKRIADRLTTYSNPLNNEVEIDLHIE